MNTSPPPLPTPTPLAPTLLPATDSESDSGDEFLKDNYSGALPPTRVNPDDVCFGCCPLRGTDSTGHPRVSPNPRPAIPYQYDRHCTDSGARPSGALTPRARSPLLRRTSPSPTDHRPLPAALPATPASRSRSSRPLSRTSSRPPTVLIPAPAGTTPFLAPPGLDAPSQSQRPQDESQANRSYRDWSSTGWRSSWQEGSTETNRSSQWGSQTWETYPAWTNRDRPGDRPSWSHNQREPNNQWRRS